MKLPAFYRIHQKLPYPVVADVAEEVRTAIAGLRLGPRLVRGARVAVTGGSRGVANIALILRTVCDCLKEVGARPFIVPAMGSHGGATAEGQVEILAGYGVSPERMGVPILSSMETVEIARMDWGLPVLVDRHACEADHIILVNRVKPHTSIRGPIESGLLKMLVIGLGKHRGALLAHRAAVDVSLERMVPEVARVSLSKLPVLFGLATVENARHETACVEAILPEHLEAAEKRLLVEAKALIARIPFDFLHLLIVDEIGKEISGACMDSNVTGRIPREGVIDPAAPRYLRIFARDLTDQSGGNAEGLGTADFATTRLAEKVDRHITYTNALTSAAPLGAKFPMLYDTDRQAIEAALTTIGLTEPPDAKIARIRNTLALERLVVSEALLPEVRRRPALEVMDGPFELRFGEDGNLLDQVE
jgi:hypothetical protein